MSSGCKVAAGTEVQFVEKEVSPRVSCPSTSVWQRPAGTVSRDLQIPAALPRVRVIAVRSSLPWGGVVHLSCIKIESTVIFSKIFVYHALLHDVVIPELQLKV